MLFVGHQHQYQSAKSSERARFYLTTTSLSFCCLTLLACIFSSQHQVTFGAFVAANEQVGYRACVHLMLRLVDCLIDACDLYLAQLAGPASVTPSRNQQQQQPIAVDASNLLNEKGNIRIEAIDKDLLWPNDDGELNGGQVEFPSTKPMNWQAPILPDHNQDPIKANKTSGSTTTTTTTAVLNSTTTIQPSKSSAHLSQDKQPLPLLSQQQQQQQQPGALDTDSNKPLLDEDQLSTSSCWPKAIKWIKEQLITLRMNLMNGAKASLRDTLDRFSELNAYLLDVCPTLTIGDSQPKMDHLGYVVEAIEVLNQINEDSKEKKAENGGASLVGDEGGVGANKEKTATDAIKENYSYLTQIITSYNLVFNGIDGDIMGERGEQSNKEGGVPSGFDVEPKKGPNSKEEPSAKKTNNDTRF